MKDLLERAGKYAVEESPNSLAMCPNLYNLAKSENLDNLSREATFLISFI